MKVPRFTTIEEDGWRLESSEARHAEWPDTFQIPSRERRESLVVGDAAKLLCDIAAEDEDGLQRGVERMWVIVRRRVGELYVGVLDSTPASIEPNPELLARGSEIVCGPEHVVDISSPPRHYIVENYGEEFFMDGETTHRS